MDELTPEQYNPTQMLGAAKAFLSAVEKCNDPPVKELGWIHPRLVPIVVNAVFACGASLKNNIAET